jgi:hypothetical protein
MKALVRIGYVNKEGHFVSVWTVYRVIKNNVVRFNNIHYKMFDPDWNCFVL